MIRPRYRLAGAALLLLNPCGLRAQDEQQANWVSGAGAGLYFGERSSYNGPVLFIRSGRKLNPYVLVGGRLEFRDDDPDGGRAQSLGAGPELTLMVTSPGIQLYGTAGFLLEALRAPETAVDPGSGLYVRPHVGIGMALGDPPAGAGFVEIDHGLTGGISYTMVTLGITSTPTAHDPAPAPAAYVQTNELMPLTDAYDTEEDYRGYTLAVDVPARTPLGHAIRISLGIDFFQFRYSTGALELLVGPVHTLFQTRDGIFSLSLIPQLGAMRFFEPSGTPPYPMVSLTVEAQLRYRGIGVFGGVGGALTHGPAGTLPGVPVRLGVVVGV